MSKKVMYVLHIILTSIFLGYISLVQLENANLIVFLAYYIVPLLVTIFYMITEYKILTIEEAKIQLPKERIIHYLSQTLLIVPIVYYLIIVKSPAESYEIILGLALYAEWMFVFSAPYLVLSTVVRRKKEQVD